MAADFCPNCSNFISTADITCSRCGHQLAVGEESKIFDSGSSSNNRSRGSRRRSEPGQPSSSQAICGVASFFFPGLGQLIQGRVLAACLHFFGAIFLWIITLFMLGWLMNIYSAWDAATYQ